MTPNKITYKICLLYEWLGAGYRVQVANVTEREYLVLKETRDEAKKAILEEFHANPPDRSACGDGVRWDIAPRWQIAEWVDVSIRTCTKSTKISMNSKGNVDNKHDLPCQPLHK